MKLHETTAVSHPFDNRAAFVCVTRSIVMKLVYQQPNSIWVETELELGTLACYGDIVTHAAFGDASSQSYSPFPYSYCDSILTRADHLLLVTYDTSKCLRLYRIGIAWNAVGGDPSLPPSVNPQISLKHVQILDRCLPQPYNRLFTNSASGMMQSTAICAELSNIQIKPPTSGTDGNFMVMAIFTNGGNDDQLSPHSKFSVISRWELQQSEATLHESFRSLKPTTEKPSSGSKVGYLLRAAWSIKR